MRPAAAAAREMLQFALPLPILAAQLMKNPAVWAPNGLERAFSDANVQNLPLKTAYAA